MKRMNFLRRITVVAIVAVTMSVAVHAQQKGDMAAGAGLSIGMGDDLTNVGLGIKYQYNILDQLRAEGSFTFFFKNDHITMWDISANMHYLFPITDQINLYPLAGLGVMGVKWKEGGHSDSDSDITLNLGGGIDYKLTDNFFLNGELKYKIRNDWNRFVISVGVAYKF